MSGNRTARLFVSDARLPEQYGQPQPLLLESITAFHSWPLLQIHQTFFPLFGEKSSGFACPFFLRFHSGIKLGCKAAKLYSADAFSPLQYEHPRGTFERHGHGRTGQH